MAKTTKSKTFYAADFGIIISAELVTAVGGAMAGLITAERISFKPVLAEITQGQTSERAHSATHVVGDPDPLIGTGPRSEEVYTANIVYTEGEALGTDLLDPYEDILIPIFALHPAVPVQFYWQVDEENSTIEHVTSATDCFLKSIGKPVGGATANKVMIPITFVTPFVTPSAVA
jgi:hypothetical protein